MRAEMELFKDKIEVSLDGRQIFYLFFGGAVIAALVFVLGVMVGKRVEARAHLDPDPQTAAVSDPLAALDQLSQKEELTFANALAGDSRAPLGDVDLLVGGSGDKAEPAAEKPAPAAEKPAPAAAKPEPAAKPAPAAAKPAPEPAVKPELAAVKPAPAAAKPEPAGGEAGDGEPRFTLQLSSFQDKGEADAFFGKLKQAGYAVYVVEATVPDKGTWYRVRLGHYDSYDAAIAAKKSFESSQHIIAYVTRL